jgi:hypothetical protein
MSGFEPLAFRSAFSARIQPEEPISSFATARESYFAVADLLLIRRERRELAELLVASKFNDDVREWAWQCSSANLGWIGGLPQITKQSVDGQSVIWLYSLRSATVGSTFAARAAGQ